MHFIRLSPERASLAAADWIELGHRARAAEDYELAREAFHGALEVGRNPLDIYRAEKGLEQIDFELLPTHAEQPEAVSSRAFQTSEPHP